PPAAIGFPTDTLALLLAMLLSFQERAAPLFLDIPRRGNLLFGHQCRGDLIPGLLRVRVREVDNRFDVHTPNTRMNMGKAPEFMSHHRSQLRRLKPRLLPTLDGYHRQVAHILVSAADAFNRDERSRPRGGDLRKHARQAVHGVQRANKEHFHVDGHRPASTDLRRVLYFLLWA